MLCSRCRKRQAVVFISGGIEGQPMESTGLCITCARELGIPQIDAVMKQFGITAENIEDMEDQFAQMAEQMPSDAPFPFSMFSGSDHDEGGEGFLEGLDDEERAEYEALDDDDEDDEDDIIDLEEEDDEDGEEEDDDDSPPSPLRRLFGDSFQFGGSTYRDGEGGSSRDARHGRGKKEKKLRYLGEYCTHLTERARKGQVDRIIGREREIERIIQILSRRSKNNPCLIGEPGVGKTAIAEGLALRIASGDVPPRLADKELYMLDLTALVAGTQFRGQFESRMKGLIDEVKRQGNIILFIDEVHTLVGTGDSEGSQNAANIMKPALSRGELQVIGATTFNEYRKNIEKDAALERRFQPIKVDEPSIADTIDMLCGIKDYYEKHHGVVLSDAIIARAVSLSERYITDRFLPDKAIDLIDEASACAALRCKAKGELYKAETIMKNFKTQLDEIMNDEERSQDYAEIAELRSSMLRHGQTIDHLLSEAMEFEVTEADLAHVIELWTGIPASRVEESEYAKLSGLADRMKLKIKGQDAAVDAVAAAIRRNRVQISPRRRPASFIFVGPTGVGKTELVKVLAQELFSSPETMIRLDMSEFMEKHTVSKIIGSPPGYVGYDEAGQLTEKVRRKPYSVLLFDEIEKAHPDVMNILLQILDEGRISDAQGRVVNFENTVIIMTSNAGSDSKEGAMGFGKTENELSMEKAMKALNDFLRPEFLARVDEVVTFNTLSDEDFVAIGRLMIGEYVASLEERGAKLTVTDRAVVWLAEKAKGGKSAARDLRGLIRREVEDRLAQMIIDNAGVPPAEVTVDVDENGIKLSVECGV